MYFSGITSSGKTRGCFHVKKCAGMIDICNIVNSMLHLGFFADTEKETNAYRATRVDMTGLL